MQVATVIPAPVAYIAVVSVGSHERSTFIGYDNSSSFTHSPLTYSIPSAFISFLLPSLLSSLIPLIAAWNGGEINLDLCEQRDERSFAGCRYLFLVNFSF